jgi:1-acyl-sn-glycerol-3-phosphate acyltransferase
MGKFLSWLIFKLTGWKVKGALPPGVKKCVMIAAPHTSNWDFIYARAAFFLMGVPVRYTIKKESMSTFPLNIILKSLGAIPVERNKERAHKSGQGSLVFAMADLFRERDELVVLVTPEGTRKFVPKWKTGFYHVALRAKVPIVLGYLDYAKKEAGIGPLVQPSGNLNEDMRKILSFYANIPAKYPEQGVVLDKMRWDYASTDTLRSAS